MSSVLSFEFPPIRKASFEMDDELFELLSLEKRSSNDFQNIIPKVAMYKDDEYFSQFSQEDQSQANWTQGSNLETLFGLEPQSCVTNSPMDVEMINQSILSFKKIMDEVATQSVLVQNSSQNHEQHTFPVKSTSIKATPLAAPASGIVSLDSASVIDICPVIQPDLGKLSVPTESELYLLREMYQYLLRVTHTFKVDDAKQLYKCHSTRLALLVFLGLSIENARKMTLVEFIKLLKMREIKLRVDKFQYQMKFYSKWVTHLYKTKKEKRKSKDSVLAELKKELQMDDETFTLMFESKRANGMHRNAVRIILINRNIRDKMLTKEYMNVILNELNEQTVSDIYTNLIRRLCDDPKTFLISLESARLESATKKSSKKSASKESEETKKDKFKLPFSYYENFTAAEEFLEKLIYRGEKKEKKEKEEKKVIEKSATVKESLEILCDLMNDFKGMQTKLTKVEPKVIH